MDQYYDINTTPLKFHNFLRFFLWPVRAIFSLFILILVIRASIGNPYGYESSFGIYIFLAFLEVGATALTLYGMYTWKPCGFYGVFVMYGLEIFNEVFGPSLGYAEDVSAFSVIIDVGIAVLVYIYYLKRRPLFFENMRAAYYRARQAEQKLQEERKKEKAEVMGDPTRCPVCGEKLNLGRTTCMKCGAAVPGVHTTPDTEEAATEKPRFCFQCGKRLEQGSKFCHNCGTKQN